MATPLPCNTTMIQFVGDPTQWVNINVLTGTATSIGGLNPPDYVNAIGLNPLDNLIYGYSITNNQIVQVDANADVTYLGLPTGLPANGYNTGCFDVNGFFYITLNGTRRFYTIDLRPESATYMRLVDPLNGYVAQTANYGTGMNNAAMNVSDWVCDSNGFLYGIQSNGTMQRLNLANGNVISMTTTGPNPNASFGAVAIDKDNIIYAIENKSGGVYKYTVTGITATAEYLSSTYAASQNDGTMCLNASFIPEDDPIPDDPEPDDPEPDDPEPEDPDDPPTPDPTPCVVSSEDAFNQIIASISMEKLALSHVINAEGEKIQYILGTLEGTEPLDLTIEEILEVNNSAKDVLDAVAQMESILSIKLTNTLKNYPL